VNPLRIMVVDDHELVRTGLQQTLNQQTGLRVVAACGNGSQALHALRARSCDVLLLDLALPDMSGLDVLRQVRQSQPDLPVLVLSGYPETQFGVQVLRAGASGFIGKDTEAAELVRAIRTVARGNRYVGQGLTDALVNGLQGTVSTPLHEQLSVREFQVFYKLAAGLGVTEIGAQLSLSAKTISTYRSRVLAKLELRTTSELISYAIHNHLVR
jgi:DNA-binding NarL/FixJ family response regulator